MTDRMDAFEEAAEVVRQKLSEEALARLTAPTERRSTAPIYKDPDTGLTAAVQPAGIEQDPQDPAGVLVPQASPDGLTWNAPLVRVEVPKGISASTFRQVIATSYQMYLMDGRINRDGIVKALGQLPAKSVTLVLDSPEYRAAMKVRGVEVIPTGLTPEMDFALMIIADPHDGLNFKRKLDKAQISSAKYQAWLRNPDFKAQINRLSEQLVANSHEALVMLSQKVGEGDLAAIKFQLEVNSRYNPQQQQQMDSMVFMQRVLEIIANNVRDPDILRNVAAEMKQLADHAFQERVIPGTGL